MTTVLLMPATPAQFKPLAAAVAEAVAAAAPQVRLLSAFDPLGDDEWAAVEVLLGWRCPRELRRRLPTLTRLRWVASMAAGVEKLLVPELPAALPLTRIVDPDQALGMAQYTAAMLLRHLRGLARYEQQQGAHDWSRHPMAATRARVCVLGAGEVGREVARVLQALGCSVRLWRRDGTPLAAALHDAEVVVNTLPLTAETEGLLDARAFAALPRGAYLVNIARGGHVVEADLIAAVASGRLSGAALDVQHTEPLPADDPLWAVPGITITPHIAAQPKDSVVAEQFAANLARLRAGQPLLNRVDRARGY